MMEKLNELILKACLASAMGKKGITVDLKMLSQIRDEFWAVENRAEAAEEALKSPPAAAPAVPDEALIDKVCLTAAGIFGQDDPEEAQEIVNRIRAMLAAAPEVKALQRCAAARDGECNHAQCPQLRDGEPGNSGRHCPIDNWDEDD